MPNTTSQADDDILELTEVVETGKPQPEGGVPSSAIPSSPVGDPTLGADFGADLDALLDSLGAESPPPAPPQEPTFASAPAPAPIADPTPADHHVDPNEELQLPELSDIDSLLAELGVPAAAAAPAPATTPEPAPAAPEPKGTTVLDDLPDDLAAMIANAAPVAPPRAAVPQPVVEQQKSPAVEEPAPLEAEGLPEASAHAVPVVLGPPAAGGAPGSDSIDLNELDALLDDMLATAPAPGPALTAPDEPQNALVEPGTGPVPEPAALLTQPEPGALPPEATEALVAALAGRVDTLEDSISTIQTEQAYMMDSAAFASRLDSLESALATLQADQAGLKEPAPQLDIDALLEEKLAALLAPGSPALEAVLQAVTAQLLEEFAAAEAESGAGAALRHALDKSASAAAAKVIREEIAALLQG